MNDSEILQLIAAGDERGLRELERAYSDHCAEKALEVLDAAELDAAGTGEGSAVSRREIARQCAFDAFLKLWNSRGNIDPATFPLREYLDDTVRNVALSRRSRNASMPATPLEWAAAPAVSGAVPARSGEFKGPIKSGWITGFDEAPETANASGATDANSAASDAADATTGTSASSKKKRKIRLIIAGAVALVLLIAAVITGAVINSRSSRKKDPSLDRVTPPRRSADATAAPGRTSARTAFPGVTPDPSATPDHSATPGHATGPVYDPTAVPTAVPTEQIPETFPPTEEPSPTPIVEKTLSVDLNLDGYAETIAVERNQVDLNSFTVSVKEGTEKDNGKVIWAIGADVSHSGWTGCCLCVIGERYGILVYRPEVYQGEAAYSFTVYGFSKEFGAYVEDYGAVSFSMTGRTPLPVKAMVTFADRVNIYLASNTLLLSTLDGQVSTGGGLPAEKYSWTATYAPDGDASLSRPMEERLNEVRDILYRSYHDDFDIIIND